jgi:hypothetical protein
MSGEAAVLDDVIGTGRKHPRRLVFDLLFQVLEEGTRAQLSRPCRSRAGGVGPASRVHVGWKTAFAVPAL